MGFRLLLVYGLSSRKHGRHPKQTEPFEVLLPATSSVSGVVLADQVKSLDWRARRARFESHAPRQVVGEALEQISVLLE